MKLFSKQLLGLVVLFASCASNNYKLEKNIPFNVKQAYFEKWTAGVKGGGSGLNIYFVLEKDNTEVFQINGIYIRSSYSKLKLGQPNTYQGYIKTNENSEVISVDGNVSNKSKDDKLIEIPFELKGNEAVVVFTKNGDKKYFKIILEEKQPKYYPR